MASESISTPRATRQVRVWDLPLRLFHWLLVAAIAVAFLSSEEESPLSRWHILAGWIAAVLILFRIVWGFVGGEHARWSDFLRPAGLPGHLAELARLRPQATLGHNPLGALSVLALLLLAAAVVWTGATVSGAGEELHELLAWSLLALIGLHIVAVILMSFLTRENLVRAMVTGRKLGDRHPGARDARSPPWYAWLLGALAVAGAVYAVRSYDPIAFTPRNAESRERSADHGRSRAAGGDAPAKAGEDQD